MRQVFLQKGNVVIKDVPPPLLEDYLILVRVHYSFISPGTEMATLNATSQSLLKRLMEHPAKYAGKFIAAVAENGLQGTLALLKSKQLGELSNAGYSCSGQVIAVGKMVQRIKVGDFVACAGAGIANHADIVAVPENLTVKVQDPAFLKEASLTTIGAIALQGIRRADLRLGERLCVIGLGLIGQLTVQLAKLSGYEVFALDIHDYRVEKARECGADYAYNSSEVAVKREIDFATMHQGVDATIITAASSSGAIIDQAMNITRRKGRVVLVGDVKLDFERDQFYAKEIDFLISCSYGPGRYDHTYEKLGHDYPLAYVRWTENRNMQFFVSLVEQKKININKLISHNVNVEDAMRAYDALKERSVLGVVLDYTAYQDDVSVKKNYTKADRPAVPYVAPQQELNIAVVGVGGFTKVKLLPLIKSLKGTKIHTIIDVDNANALNTAHQYLAVNSCNDYETILSDSSIHAVVIATPHKFHTEQALACLQAGKAVFLEKPAAITWEQYENLETYLDSNPQSIFTVDFNRSWAPFNQKIKKIVSQRHSPLIVHYRMNAGYIPNSHWIQQQGGRILGEACHIFELFCSLVGAQPTSVSVESLNSPHENVFSHDNITTQIKFADGSCCSLIYTAIGNTDMAKERMEVFFDGKSVIMDDYYELKGFGVPSSFNIKALTQDKGHQALLEQFASSAQGISAHVPIPFKQILWATKISLIVDDLARLGGGYRKFS